MQKLEVEKEAVALLKSGLEIEKKLLEQSHEKYKKEIVTFEKEYGMSSKKFFDEFNSGNLGDDEKWFDWLFAYKAYNHAKEKLELAKKIKL
ncbi:hypothetical protein GWO43_25135 [candidate division KSB1 bacterium]|nr:hypothetical protein [candidate division KSB1 bacterium]NIR68847.1 hypothetical protein [candidate division KSB1 bacterium]NIS27211.1 hypothetical protein [candidate division KSB1 bacterium]NIT74096.1 hypothetical protein [candidate division KSB1 bacterium]NIU27945.1 hypothetical protein [candidate division KSB1 bacterium]